MSKEIALLLATALAFSGCDQQSNDRTPPVEPAPRRTLLDALSPGLAASLGPSGLLQVSSIEKSSTSGSVLSTSAAEKLATQFIRVFGPSTRAYLERDHAETLDFSQLVPMGRSVVSQSPYVPLDPGIQNPARKSTGPYYLVTLGYGGISRVLVAVSAYATDISLEGGMLRYTGSQGMRGNEFRWYGIPKGKSSLIVSAEEAAELAHLSTGRRVAEPPVFVRRGVDYGPTIGYWKLKLDQPATAMLPNGARVLSDVVFIEGRARVFGVSEGPAIADAYHNSLFAEQGGQIVLKRRTGMEQNITPVTMSR